MNNLDDKQQLGETHGGYVAEVIRHIHPAVPLSIVSHSYGAVPLAAALQTLAVTSTEEFDHPDHSNCRRSIQAAMLAGALGAYDFSPCGKFPLALSQLQRLAVTVNPSDKTLLLMNRIDRDDHIVGLMGLRDVPLAELPKISQWNIHSWVHRHHWLIWMLIHEQVAATLRPYFVNTLPRAFVEDVIPAELPVENVQPLPPAVPPREPPPKFK